MAVLDIHCHFFPKAFLDEARRPNTLQAKIERRDDGQEHLVCAGNFDHPLTPDFYAAERMLADMDAAGIEMAAISSAPPTLSYWAEPAAARRLAPLLNESIAERVATTLIVFLALPLCPCKIYKPHNMKPSAPLTS